MKRLIFVAGMATAVLGLTGVGAAGAADGSAHGVPGKRVGEVIRCNEVNADLPNVMGRDCDSTTWGPLSNFTLIDRGSGGAYQCQSGWAEGGLWVNGQGCRPIPA
ncbi:hypothetical protein ACFVHI_29980 [Kitasatospora sp. NPDC127121]|uniref:hypothetical protein n=1 Tax=Kitasatospora sp. NPDC127121 TaxID=3345371 RepID=UPI00362EBB05